MSGIYYRLGAPVSDRRKALHTSAVKRSGIFAICVSSPTVRESLHH